MDSVTFILVIAAGLFHALWNFFTKKSKVDRITLLWLGQVLVGLSVFPISLTMIDVNLLTDEFMPFIVLTGIIHALYLSLLGWSYKVGEVSTVYPISRGSGIIGTSLIAIILEIDQVSHIGLLGIGVLSFGILIISLKKDLNKNVILLSSLSVGMAISLYSIVDKLGVQYVPPFFYGSIMFLSTAFFLTPFVFYKRRSHIKEIFTKHKLHSFSISAAMLGTYCLILFAFQNTQASYVVALREISIVIASLLGIMIMKEEVNRRKICGLSLILAGASIIKFA